MNAVTKVIDNWKRRTDVAGARRFVCAVTRLVGTGFHPDTPFSDYISHGKVATVTFDAQTASSLQEAFDQAVALLEQAGIDPCEVALPVQQGMFSKM